MPSDPVRSRIPTLDGWRAVAIAIVMGVHGLLSAGVPAGPKLALIFNRGGFGVDIFFSLSGYLIATLLLREKRIAGGISLRRFYLRRAFRILPPIFVFLGAVEIVSARTALRRVGVSEILATVLFARNYFTGTLSTHHFWSLAVEEHFYLMIPAVLALLSLPRALSCCAGLALASIVSRAVEARFASVLGGDDFVFRTENQLDGLMLGVILAILLHRPDIRGWIRKRLSSAAMLGLASGTLALAMVFKSPEARRTIAALVLPAFIAHTVLHPRAILGRLLELPAVRWIGRLSYGLYIWQQLFLARDSSRDLWFQGLPQSAILTLACAVLSYYIVERPMLRLGRRIAASF